MYTTVSMVMRCCTQVLWLLLGALISTHGSQALQWVGPPANGSTVHRCVGEDANFSWRYSLQSTDAVMAAFWFSEQNGTLASQFAGHYMTLSDRVTYDQGAGLTLHALRPADSGLYGVYVKLLNQDDMHNKVVHLVVVDPPVLADGQVMVMEEEEQDGPCDQHGPCDADRHLKCGPFSTPSLPRDAMVWTDPQGRQLNSTRYSNGFFWLRLPHTAVGGNYTCTLQLSQEESECLRGGDTVLSASRFVHSTETQLRDHAKQLDFVQRELEDMREHESESTPEFLMHNMTQLQASFDQLSTAQQLATAELQTQLATQQQIIQNQTTLIEQLQAAADRLQQSCAQAQERSSNLAGRQTQLQQDIDNILRKQNSLTTALGEVEQRLGQSVSTQVAVLQDRVDQLDANLNDSTHNLASLLSAQSQDVSTLKRSKHDVEQQLADLTQKKDALQQKTQSLESDLTNVTQVLDVQIKTVQHLFEDRDSRADLNYQQLQQHLEQLRQNQDTMKAAFTDTTAFLNTSQGSLAQRVQELLVEQSQQRQTSQDLQVSVAALSVNQTTVRVGLQDVQSGVQSLLQQSSQWQGTLGSRLDTVESKVGGVERRLNQTMASSGVQEQLTALADRLSVQERDGGVARVREQLQDFVTFNSKLHPIRLVGGSSSREGRVEVLVGKEWGTVCDDDWDDNDAKVVCFMMGFSRTGARGRKEAAFGQGSGPIVMDDLRCAGTEDDIRVCPTSTAFGAHNCGHHEDAGVVCNP